MDQNEDASPKSFWFPKFRVLMTSFRQETLIVSCLTYPQSHALARSSFFPLNSYLDGLKFVLLISLGSPWLTKTHISIHLQKNLRFLREWRSGTPEDSKWPIKLDT